MATKSKKKAVASPKEKFNFVKMNYNVGALHGCCGIGVIYGFCEDEGSWGYNDQYSSYSKHTPAKKLYVTKKQQAEACYKDFVEATFTGYNHYTQLLISLVSHYKDGDGPGDKEAQYPELEEILLREGWTIYSVFINPNHGNEVTLYGKYFPERDVSEEEIDEMEEADEEW